MSFYCVSIGSREYRVSINGGRVTIDGVNVPVDLLPLNKDGLHLLRRGSQAVEVYMSAQNEDTFEMLVGGRRIVARVQPPHRANRSEASRTESNTLTAPMPGLVVEVLVKEGDLVEKGQTLVVLESMKMQMQLRSPAAGKVAAVGVNARAQVDKGAQLVRVSAQ